MQLRNRQADSGWLANSSSLLRGSRMSTSPFRSLLGQLLIRAGFLFSLDFAADQILMILFPHFSSLLSLSLTFLFTDIFTSVSFFVFPLALVSETVFFSPSLIVFSNDHVCLSTVVTRTCLGGYGLCHHNPSNPLS